MNKLNYETTSLVSTLLGKTVMWAILFVIGFLTTLYGAFVLRELWQWFAVPAGFDMITKRTSIGIFLIVGLLKATISGGSSSDDGDQPTYARSIVILLGYMVFFTLSWISAAIWHFWLL